MERAKKSKKKRIWLRVLLAILIVVVVVVVYLGVQIYSMLHPTPMQSGDGEKTVVCIGDSITYGQGVLKSRKSDSYPAILSGLLGEEYRVMNYGACNRTMLSTGNMTYQETGFVEQSLQEEPDIVILMMGTNDSKPENWDAEQFEKDYAAVVEQYASAKSQPEIYLMLPPSSYREEDKNMEDETRIDNEIVCGELQEIIRRVAKEHGAQVIDLNTLTDGKAELFADGLHPNAEGNRLIAEEIYRVISGK